MTYNDTSAGTIEATGAEEDRLERAAGESVAEWDFVRAQIGGR